MTRLTVVLNSRVFSAIDRHTHQQKCNVGCEEIIKKNNMTFRIAHTVLVSQ